MTPRKVKFELQFFSATCIILALVLLSRGSIFAQTCGNPGKDGPGGTISGVLNTYYPPSGSTVTVNAGASSIALGAASSSGSTTPIAVGDLVLIMQMQNTTFTTTTDTSGYGSYSTTTAGQYEFAVATSAVPASGGTLTLSAGLAYSYAQAPASTTVGQKRFQVIRVPQYSSATLGNVTGARWDGSTGGVVAIDVAGTLALGGGSIDVSGRGFRGGGGINAAGGSQTATYRFPSTSNTGGSKGEGIGGTPRYVFDSTTSSVVDYGTALEGYPNGSFGRGAPANGGGGGRDGDPTANDENSGGAGGGNGGAGGIGGNSWNSNLATGGIGGRAVTSNATKIVMGGGGGAGTTNNSAGYLTSGAAGGGIVIVRAGTVSGSGTINANGATALDIDQDGAGGGGAGGSVVVTANSGTLAGLSITANGGGGGDSWLNTAGSANAHGPGGGGGGGVVYQSGGATVSVIGGAHGVTTSGRLQYGSSDGASGVSSTTTSSSLPGTSSGAQCVPVLTVTKLTSTPSVLQGGSATYTITVTNASGVATAQQVSISDTLPQPVAAGFTFASTGTITYSNGAARGTATNPNVGDTIPSWGVFTIPANGQVAITFTVNLAYGVPPATYQNPATATYLDPGRTTSTGTKSSSYTASSSTAEDVTVSTAILISGNVYSDTNHDGNIDSDESWTGPSVFVNLVSGGAVKQSVQVLAGTGSYSFLPVVPGTYTVVVTNSATATTASLPSGWAAVSPSGASLNLVTGTSSLLHQDFGFFSGSKLTGSVFVDDGSGGGTANDGKLNGAEKGIPNVSVAATNGSSVTYDSTKTDGSGAFALWIPSSATAVTLKETEPLGYVATGADVGNTSGTYTRSTTSISFTYSASIVYANVRFGEVPVNTLNPDNSLSGMPGTSVLYTHTFQALSAGQVSFSTTAVSGQANGFAEIIYRDLACNGVFDASDPQITSAVPVTAGTKVCIIVKEMISSSVPYDAVNSITVKAQFVYTNATPALSTNYVCTDLTTVGNSTAAGLRLTKSVDKATAKSGDTLSYTIVFSNVSSGTVSNIVVADTTPTYTTFVSAACGTLPAGISACSVTTQPSVGGTGSIKWTLTGSLASSASGQVTFSVKIQ